MTVKSARAAVEVVGGLLPGQPMQEWTKQWFLTSEEWEGGSLRGRRRLAKLRREAQAYADGMPFPHLLNWVRVDIVWF